MMAGLALIEILMMAWIEMKGEKLQSEWASLSLLYSDVFP